MINNYYNHFILIPCNLTFYYIPNRTLVIIPIFASVECWNDNQYDGCPLFKISAAIIQNSDFYSNVTYYMIFLTEDWI